MIKTNRFIPSNGTDGILFMEEFCSNCIHEKWMHNQDSDEGKCEILSNSMLHDRPCYDKDLEHDGWEWFDNDDYNNYEWGCNQFKDWDWGNGDPPEPIPYDPNQLCFPFLSETIEKILTEEMELQK